MKLNTAVLFALLAVSTANLLVSLRIPHIPQEVSKIISRKNDMATRTLGPTNVTTTIDGVNVVVPVSVTVTQGEDVPENVASPKSSETIAQLDTRAFAAMSAAIKTVKTSGT